MNDLHRHDMFSRFDGFGKPIELARLAKELGHTALSTANHGNTNGLVQTYNACKEVGIKAILGVEGYFLPVYKPQQRGYHLCLFAKNLKGYQNLNTLQYEGEKQKYYNPIWTFDLLEQYHDGLICTSACVASYLSQCIVKGDYQKAKKYLKKMQSIFGDDFYLEIQPYKVSEKGLQETVNCGTIELGKELDIKCILTSDSHRGRKEDLETYLIMHQMDGHDMEWAEGTYKERYMPTEEEIIQRFIAMHRKEYGSQTKKMALAMVKNLEEIEEKIEENILDGLELKLPKISEQNNEKEIIKQIKEGLKERGKYLPEYIKRCKEELDVIKTNGYIDYFLMVSDYVKWAKDNGIVVGPGRGSVCNCLVAFALKITDVDSIKFNLDFRRFMRYDKKAMPDIDIDFEMDRRGEVIEYLINKYPNKAARVSAYGLYQIDNTINELAKVCGLPTDKEIDKYEVKKNKEVIASIKSLVSQYKTEKGEIDEDALLFGSDQRYVKELNQKYNNIIMHFMKLYGKIKYVGTHAAGVVITSGDILQYTALRIDKNGSIYAAYDLDDLNDINLIKFDLLGLKTMQSIGECRKLADKKDFDINYVDDKKILENFRLGNTCGIFQFEKKAVKKILDEINCDCFNDVIAACSMNRPAPLSQGIPQIYAENKASGMMENEVIAPYTDETYGAIIYQEQMLLICVNIGGFTWQEADKVLKASKHGSRENALIILEKHAIDTGVDLQKKFFKNAKKNGMSEEQIHNVWEALLVYSFNKGHGAGYCIISAEEMYYKIYYPPFFWYSKIKYAKDEKEKEIFCNEAVKSDITVFLPHVNYSKQMTTLRKTEGELVLQKGITDLKGIGEKAADIIVAERKNGIFTSFDNFCERCKGRAVTKKVIEILKEQSALEFSKEKYIRSVITYNASLYGRAQK